MVKLLQTKRRTNRLFLLPFFVSHELPVEKGRQEAVDFHKNEMAEKELARSRASPAEMAVLQDRVFIDKEKQLAEHV